MTDDNPNNRDYTGDTITVHWRPTLCVHCRVCVTELPEVFDLDARPWVNIKGAPEPRIVEQVSRCPSNALSITHHE